MTDSRAALDMDRLPWLTDEREPAPARKISWAAVVPWALLFILLVAGVSYWLGMRSAVEPEAFVDNTQPRSEATATLPEPTVQPAESVEPPPMSEVKPVAEPAPVRIAPATTLHRTREPGRRAPGAPKDRSAASAPDEKSADAKPKKLEYWPAIESTGANGRMARIGTFTSRRQAKKAWWAIVRHYPGMRSLKAVVAPVPSLRNGKT